MPGKTAKKLSALMFRVMDKMRHRAAFDIGRPTQADQVIAANWSWPTNPPGRRACTRLEKTAEFSL
ncbi:hypothetical protein [Mycobacterium talmoniae]|uniref:Uncharacterized protein n=1 Tax=Mycobacterium talmoniae TaxID=1858794 RepID=A0A1S1NL39_9MYCO|nr:MULTISPECIES: hypothetical protein [Mycobacterium]OHV04742.1 hypothetical protein BKN37_08440 [Mycobacterium talmoniae]TDH51873.1 hypothetical protein E2F47_15145 [Mycobacterium eburneum]